MAPTSSQRIWADPQSDVDSEETRRAPKPADDGFARSHILSKLERWLLPVEVSQEPSLMPR